MRELERRWEAVDQEIFHSRRLQAVGQVRELLGCGLKEALEIVHERAARLRVEQPERFTAGR